MARKRRNRRSTDLQPDAYDEDTLLRVIPDTASIESISPETELQELWAGYGSVRSFTVRRTTTFGGREEAEDVDLVVKRVRPPPPPTTTTGDGIGGASASHARKMRSYEVEAEFYTRYAPRVAQAATGACALPTAFDVCHPSSESSDRHAPSSFTFLLSDLRRDFPSPDPYRMDRTRTEAALRWLASFHAVFWEAGEVGDTAAALTRPGGSLWECGGYWHLDTRHEELECISEREWGRLKTGAFAIDRRMRRRPCEFWTICHGDFKSANLLFRTDGTGCAAVDFQYVGGGYGMKDVVMLIVSSVDPGVVGYGRRDGVLDLIRFYHGEVVRNLRSVGRVREGRIAAYSPDVAMRHFELCLMDYVRFMAGWGFWGENYRYAQDECLNIMNDMEKAGADLGTDQGWETALQTRYP